MTTIDDSMYSPQPREADEVAIDYLKLQDFRAVWADGVIGGPTPSGHLHFAVYAERPAIPRRHVHKLNRATGQLSQPLAEKTIGRQSIVRELAFDVLMTPDTALTLAAWLVEQVSAMKKTAGET